MEQRNERLELRGGETDRAGHSLSSSSFRGAWGPSAPSLLPLLPAEASPVFSGGFCTFYPESWQDLRGGKGIGLTVG